MSATADVYATPAAPPGQSPPPRRPSAFGALRASNRALPAVTRVSSNRRAAGRADAGLALALAGLLAALVAVLIPGGPAWAHNELRSATPAKGATVKTAPTKIVLSFHQRLNPDFTTVVITDADQRRVAAGDPAVTGDTAITKIESPLANGAYTVAYRVVSRDGHPVSGAYRFTVADADADAASPSAAAPTTASLATASPGAASPATASPGAQSPGAQSSPVAAASPAAPGDDSSSVLRAGVAVVALAAIAGLGGFALYRRRRNQKSAD